MLNKKMGYLPLTLALSHKGRGKNVRHRAKGEERRA